MAGKNNVLVPGAKSAMERMKEEMAEEIGIPDYDRTDKGQLTSRENGMVGGMMVKRMIEAYEQNMTNRK